MRILVVGTLAVGVACASSSATLPPNDGRVAVGTWGGDTAGMIVQDTLVHLHIGCTYGDIHGRPVLDVNGRFDASGSYLLKAYPIAVGPTMPARFVGQLEKNVITVTVTVTDTVQKSQVTLGPVAVTYLQEPRMRNCPICKRPGDRPVL
jgi:hypothetical protein